MGRLMKESQLDKDTQVLLILDGKQYIHRRTRNDMENARCFVAEGKRKHGGKLRAVLHPQDDNHFTVVCENHLEQYLDAGWKLYEGGE